MSSIDAIRSPEGEARLPPLVELVLGIVAWTLTTARSLTSRGCVGVKTVIGH